MESFSVELKTLAACKPIKNSSKIAIYSPFIGPAGITRFTGQIVRLVGTEFDIRHPILLDAARYTLVRLLARSLRHQLFHQVLDYMRSVLNIKYAILGGASTFSIAKKIRFVSIIKYAILGVRISKINV